MNLKDYIHTQEKHRYLNDLLSLLPNLYKGDLDKFLDDYEKILKEEYPANITPQYCYIEGVKFLVPASYNNDIDSFLNDISYFQNNEDRKYEIYNKCKKDKTLSPSELMLSVEIGGGDDTDKVLHDYPLHMLIPLKMAKRQATNQEIKFELMHKMIARYMTAFTKNCRLNEDKLSEQSEIKEKINTSREGITKDRILALINQLENKLYTTINNQSPIKKRSISLNQKYFSYCNNEHTKFIAKKIIRRLGSGLKWSTKQTADVVFGLIGSPFFVAYTMLDKKYHISEKKLSGTLGNIRDFAHTSLNDYVKPKIPKALLIASISTAFTIGIKHNEQVIKIKEDIKKELNEKKQVREIDAIQNKRYKITDKQSFDELYDAAFSLIIKSMLPTEMLITQGYSDNNKGVLNTIGIGSYWHPKNGNYTSSEWIKTSEFLRNRPNYTITPTQAKDLTDGWFRYRENGRIYDKMFKLLQGCELKVCEFAAIASCCYNSEAKGFDLCSYVHNNYKEPLKCANYLINLKCDDSSFEAGIDKRHLHECLLYLNVEDYQQKIGMFLLKKNNSGRFCGSSVTQLSTEQCERVRQDLKKGNLTEAKNTAHLIFNYVCKNGVTIDEVTGSCFNIDYEMAEIRHNSDEMYKAALSSYNKGDYQKAYDGFQAMIDAGYNGADILNDLAITQYHMGKYKECIATCQKILETGETGQYSPANYNAGMAYEKMGNYLKAYENYSVNSTLTQ